MDKQLHAEIIKNPSTVGMLYSEAEDLEKLKAFKESSNKKSTVKIDKKTRSIIEKLKSTTR